MTDEEPRRLIIVEIEDEDEDEDEDENEDEDEDEDEDYYPGEGILIHCPNCGQWSEEICDACNGCIYCCECDD